MGQENGSDAKAEIKNFSHCSSVHSGDDEMIFDDGEDANMDGGEDVRNGEGVGGSRGV